MSERGIFITGFPGFIAGRLLDRLVEQHGSGARYFFLVQPAFIFRARAACEEAERRRPELEGRWFLIEGDIRQPNLGMALRDLEQVRAETHDVWHIAAIYDLAVRQSIAHAINVDGTRNVLDLCESLPSFERLMYISTCYVAGDRQGVVYENELDVGQDFKNHYEATKFWAECEVARRQSSLPTMVLRPAIVVGDSQTGETIKGDGPYYVIRLLETLPRFVPFAHLGPSLSKVNVVPADFVVEAMARLSTMPQALGKTFHLADPEPLAARQLVTLIIKYLGRAPALGAIPQSIADRLISMPAVCKLMNIPYEAFSYFGHPVEFDVTQATELLAPTGCRCPKIEEYLPRLIEYARAHPEIYG